MLTVKENRVPRVEYGLRRRERSLFFFEELASSWDNCLSQDETHSLQ